jgi:hypothetical protein
MEKKKERKIARNARIKQKHRLNAIKLINLTQKR